MKKTALYNKHVELGAKMVPFAGFDMPVQYAGVTEEHFAVREKAGMFDVSHMGQFIIEGAGAKDLLQICNDQRPKYADCRKSPVFLPSKRTRRNSG